MEQDLLSDTLELDTSNPEWATNGSRRACGRS